MPETKHAFWNRDKHLDAVFYLGRRSERASALIKHRVHAERVRKPSSNKLSPLAVCEAINSILLNVSPDKNPYLGESPQRAFCPCLVSNSLTRSAGTNFCAEKNFALKFLSMCLSLLLKFLRQNFCFISRRKRLKLITPRTRTFVVCEFLWGYKRAALIFT